MTPTDVLRESARGWRRLATLLAGSAATVTLAVLAGALVVVPLWFLATNYTTAYTVAALILLTGLGITAVVLALIRRHRGQGRTGGALIRIVRAVLTPIVLIAAGYGLALLYVHGLYVPAAAATLIVIFGLGFLLSRRSRAHER